jgi:DNA-binding response OmpR family regulator
MSPHGDPTISTTWALRHLARLGRLRRPSLPILFVTGFADTAVLAAETPSDRILRKPFTVADLVAKTGALLRIGSTLEEKPLLRVEKCSPAFRQSDLEARPMAPRSLARSLRWSKRQNQTQFNVPARDQEP